MIGLLSCQSSYDEPTQYRDGTLWFDLTTETMRISKNSAWESLASVIAVETGTSPATTTTLAEWFNTLSSYLATFGPELTFSGTCSLDGVGTIPIPISLQTNLTNASRGFVYKNGLLLDPRLCQLTGGSPPTTINLDGPTLDDGDTFTVLIKTIQTGDYYTPTVAVP